MIIAVVDIGIITIQIELFHLQINSNNNATMKQ